MVCSCAMSFNCVWLQIIFCLMRERNHAWYVIAWKKADRFASRRYSLKNKLGDPMTKQFLNSVATTYRDLPVSRTSIICLSLRLRQIIDLLATDTSRYFAQPRPIIVNYYTSDSLWKIWLVESIQSIHNSLWTWHDKCNICCRYCIYHVKFNVCLVTKPLGVFSSETEWLNRDFQLMFTKIFR